MCPQVINVWPMAWTKNDVMSASDSDIRVLVVFHSHTFKNYDYVMLYIGTRLL